MTLIKSKYTILSNKPLNKDFSGAYYEIDYKLPPWFVNWDKNKVIKVYGCSFAYLESKNKEPIPSQKYANQFISVHSNIVRDDTEILLSAYPTIDDLPGEFNKNDESGLNENYMMVCNNYYTPKIYDLSNSKINYIKIWFKDSHGERIIIRSTYATKDENGDLQLNEIEQAVFKMECELAIME
jgi:hypothetical protein